MTEIFLDVKKHCIETAIKGRYDRVLSQYFRSKGKCREAGKKLELLSTALSKFDFPALRAGHRELAGGIAAKIILTENHLKEPCILINGHPIDMPPHCSHSIIGNTLE